MEHFAPHLSSAFEGYYSKFDLPSNAHVVLVICTVPNAQALPPHMVSFTYYPSNGSPIYQREHWVQSIERIKNGPENAFELRVEGMGSMRVDADSTTTYNFECSEWRLEGTSGERTAWRNGYRKGGWTDTPEGWLVRLPLPLHWHVHSLSSPASLQLGIRSVDLPEADQHGIAVLHQEKNWASAFPESHIWVQARDAENDRGICLAGGKILGMDAFLVGYRSKDLDINISPPFAVAFLGMSPFMSHSVDYPNRSFSIVVSNLFHKLVITAVAPKDSGWFGLGAPFPEGHRRNFCTESFLAVVSVEVYEWRRWTWVWSLSRIEKFDRASLEFAGGYFPDRGGKQD